MEHYLQMFRLIYMQIILRVREPLCLFITVHTIFWALEGDGPSQTKTFFWMIYTSSLTVSISKKFLAKHKPSVSWKDVIYYVPFFCKTNCFLWISYNFFFYSFNFSDFSYEILLLMNSFSLVLYTYNLNICRMWLMKTLLF